MKRVSVRGREVGKSALSYVEMLEQLFHGPQGHVNVPSVLCSLWFSP